MQIAGEAFALFDHRQAGQLSTCGMQFSDGAAHADHANHIQAQSSHQQHQRDEPPPINPCHASMGEDGDEERKSRQEHDDDPRTAHGEQHSSNGTHPKEEPKPGRSIKEAEHGDLEAESNQEEQRQTGSATCSRSPARGMRPHDPGITDRKKEQGRAAHSETKPGIRFAHQRSQRKEQTNKKPEVLVELPEGESDATLPNHFIVRLDSLLACVSLCSQSVIVSCSHSRSPSFRCCE